MSDYFDGLAKLADVFFNGRQHEPGKPEPTPDPSKKPQITVRDLVQRGTSLVRCDGKLYSIVVTEATDQK